jgi:hypothetical protein
VWESLRLHDVETVLYSTPEYLVAILAYELEIREHLFEGVEPGVDSSEEGSCCPHSWETE